MTTSKNLLNTTQDFLTPDFIKKFSSALGQPAEKVHSSLRSVIPTFLMGLVNKGSSQEGAQTIVNLAQRDGFESTSGPENLNDTHYLVKGDDAVKGIFGSDLKNVASTLGTRTGLSTNHITKMMGMMAPILMGVLGRKVKNENLNATGMMSFLSEQRKVLTGFVPEGITDTSFKRPVTSYATTDGITPHYTSRGAPWVLLALLALVIMGFIWWWSGLSNKISEAPLKNVSMVQNIERSISTTAVAPRAANLDELNAFLSSGNEAELPKRFQFENLNFQTDTTKLTQGYQTEMNLISKSLTEYPEVTLRIVGFTDNTGEPAANKILSEARANAIKDQLVKNGIAPERIEVEGRGQEAPIASNLTEEGRSMNRRIELIVTNLK
jgi:OOP family OmpA-OmpF porin